MVVEDVETLKRELPALLRDDLDLRRYILELTRGENAGRQQTEDRFGRILEELRQDREANARKWEEQDRKWWKAQEENKRKWEENRADFKRVHEEIIAQAEKYDRRIGALGARWGMQSDASFRNALAGILENNFDTQVLSVNEYDDQGEVFGRPDQIELDIIIKNGLLLICELKSSID